MTASPANSFARAAARAKPTGKAIGWHRLAEFALLILLAWLLVSLVLAVITPINNSTAPVGPARITQQTPDIDPTIFARFDPFKGPSRSAQQEEVQQQQEETNETTLNLTLFGAWPNGEGEGSAIIGQSAGNQQLYRVGGADEETEIMDGVGLAEVHPGYVILSRNGIRESLYLPDRVSDGTTSFVIRGNPVPRNLPRQAGTSQPADWTIYPPVADGLSKTEDVIEALTNVFEFQPQLDASGNFSGFALFPSGDPTLFRKAGFQSGDMITGINGRVAPGDAGDLLDLFSELSPNDPINLTVQRGGARTNITLRLTDMMQ